MILLLHAITLSRLCDMLLERGHTSVGRCLTVIVH